MKTRSSTLISILCGIALAGAAAWSGSPPACAASVTISAAEIKASGIATAPLQATQYRATVEGIATVTDPQPLVALAAQLATSRAAVGAAQQQTVASAAQAKRLQALYRNNKFVSQRDEQAAVAAAAAAQAQEVSAIASDASTRAGARTEWGAELVAIASRGANAFADYVQGRRMLLAVALPIGTMAQPAATIAILQAGGREQNAALIGPSPRSDTGVQGPTFFYWTVAEDLRSGQRLSALVPVGTKPIAGVIVPDDAVLWYAGASWVYVETPSGRFTRRQISTSARAVGGWFEVTGFHTGERVVVRGGELLLSQERMPPTTQQSAGGDDDD